MAKSMALGLCFTKIKGFMKGNGRMTKRKDLELRNSLMDANIKVFIKMESLMEQGVIHGQTDNITKANGSMASSMALECGEDIEEIPIKVNGSSVNLRAMEYILGLMVINMKDNSKNASNMEKEQSDSRMEICTKAVT